MSLKKMEKIHLVRFSSLLMSLYLVLVFSLVSVSIADAQEPKTFDGCPDGSRIPAFHQPYEGPITTQFEVAPGCTVEYTYCYRCDCYKKEDKVCIGGPVYYDFYISSIKFSGVCFDFITGETIYLPQEGGFVAVYPFNPEIYQNLYEGCITDLIAAVNPWQECDMNAMGVNIPSCDKGITPVLYRAGKPSCTSDFLMWYENGTLWRGTFDCNVSPLGYYCFNTYRACWRKAANGIDYLDIIEYETGAPSTQQCPPIYQLPANIVPYPNSGQQINCNPLCGE